jgi:pyruvate/2-oxoglutarate dehydrogenase complex dihydrolipoamide dehydrogenase (E3) component
MDMLKVDLVVIGSGPAGKKGAIQAAGIGKKSSLWTAPMI